MWHRIKDYLYCIYLKLHIRITDFVISKHQRFKIVFESSDIQQQHTKCILKKPLNVDTHRNIGTILIMSVG